MFPLCAGLWFKIPTPEFSKNFLGGPPPHQMPVVLIRLGRISFFFFLVGNVKVFYTGDDLCWSFIRLEMYWGLISHSGTKPLKFCFMSEQYICSCSGAWIEWRIYKSPEKFIYFIKKSCQFFCRVQLLVTQFLLHPSVSPVGKLISYLMERFVTA